ncbi:hypothetical protein ABW19_dt0204696 [Dactylella cylindrospora]|nr:hypothetical protein ABW19_dt0204696 [Dactylella cylindrospora]
MHSLRSTFAAILAIGVVAPALAQLPVGCYDNKGETSDMGPNTYQSQSACRDQCIAADQAVWGVTKGSTCFCGTKLPDDGKVSTSECNKPCQGYPQENCGGDLAWLFGYTGIVGSDEPPKSSKTSSKSSGPSSTSVALQTTVVSQDTATVTATPSSDASQQESSGGGTNTAGIAAGVVVGVVAIIAGGIGGFLYVRRNRRRQAEEEYRAAVAAKEFTASIRKPQPDSRLDPVMLQHRRLSDGSIADNQDFSRRILKVTNPDDA